MRKTAFNGLNRHLIPPQLLAKTLLPTFGIKVMGQKNVFFQKRTGEVVENKESGLKNKPEQTGKQSGEVVENTCLWKNEPKTNRKQSGPRY